MINRGQSEGARVIFRMEPNRQLNVMETSSNVAENKFEGEQPVPENDSKRIQTIEVDV